MKRMPSGLKSYYKNELASFKREYAENHLLNAWTHLENAHVLGQAFPVEHTYIHWKMLLFGYKTKNIKEILGQIPRLMLGGVKSFVGKVPVGNTGGTNVPILKTMPIKDELKAILAKYQ